MKAIGSALVTVSILIGLVDPTGAFGPQTPLEQWGQTASSVTQRFGRRLNCSAALNTAAMKWKGGAVVVPVPS